MQSEFRIIAARPLKYPLYGPSTWVGRLRRDKYLHELIDTLGDEYEHDIIVARETKRVLFRMRLAHSLKLWRTIGRGLRVWGGKIAQQCSALASARLKTAYIWARKQIDGGDTIE